VGVEWSKFNALDESRECMQLVGKGDYRYMYVP
jgi:hypothetical protein